MIVGIPKETKSHEYRVSMLPVGVEMLTQRGHLVLVESGAGLGSGCDDNTYVKAGATLLDCASDVFDQADMIVKVKEPLPHEVAMLGGGQVVFTYFHFAASRELTLGCLEKKITAVAYETFTDGHGHLPLLTPMSEIAGRMASQAGAKCLEKPQGGRGVLLSGVPGVEPAKVTVIGGGVVGANAARIAAGMGANVVIMDVNLDRLRYLDDTMPANVCTIYSHAHALRSHVTTSDLVIGAVLIPGARSPILIPKSMLADMRPGAVIVDVGVDQGGCVETTRPTTHDDPTFVVDGVVHYCVANMPGAVGLTSTQALCHATQPHVLKLADTANLMEEAEHNPSLASAINMHQGQLIHQGVADAHGLPVQRSA